MGSKTDHSNYRPVPLTSVILVWLSSTSYTDKLQNYKPPKQTHDPGQLPTPRFRKGHSCETQLLTTLEEIARAMVNKKQVDIMILDFFEAFDTVPHKRLLEKLSPLWDTAGNPWMYIALAYTEIPEGGVGWRVVGGSISGVWSPPIAGSSDVPVVRQ